MTATSPWAHETAWIGTRGCASSSAKRSPAAIAWPGRIAPGSVTGQVNLSMDVYPTVLEAVRAAGYDRDLASARKTRSKTATVPGWNRVSVSDNQIRRPLGVGIDLGGIGGSALTDAAIEVELVQTTNQPNTETSLELEITQTKPLPARPE